MAENSGDDIETFDSILISLGVPTETRERIEAAGQAWKQQAGYESPPHDVVLPKTQMPPSKPSPVDIDPLTKTRIRTKPERLIRQLKSADPSQVEFEPFLGESARHPTGNRDLSAVLEAEVYVHAVADSIGSAVSAISAGQKEIQAAQAETLEELRAREETERLLLENLDHVQRHLDMLEPDQEPGTVVDLGRENLRALYQADLVTARSQLNLVKSWNSFDQFDAAVTDLSRWTGALADQAGLFYVVDQRRKRKQRRIWRRLRLGGASLTLPAVALVLDQAVASVWAITGSAALSVCVVAAENIVGKRLRRRQIQSQLASLVTATRESGKAVERLHYRELQFNALRALHGLPPLRLVPAELIGPLHA